MAYPTAKSNDREGGSPSKVESEKTADYMEESTAYVDREHPHQDASNRKVGDHPHKDLAKGLC